VIDRMAHWPGGHLETVPGGRHETLMDTPDMRGRLMRQLCDFYGGARHPSASDRALRASAVPQAR